MKKTMILALLLAGPMAVKAENDTVLLPAVGAVDLAAVVGSMRASTLVNSEGDVFYGAHLPIATLLGKTSGVEYANFNAGVVYSADKKRADFMTSIGIRVDSLISKAGTKWPNFKTAKLPPLEVGPFVSYGFGRFMWGGMISLRLGGK
jgi:hypothetical protein